MLLHFSLRKQVGGVLANLCRAFFHTLERNLYIKHNVSVCWNCWPQYAPGSDPEIPEKCCEHRLPSRRCWLWVSVQVQCGAHQNLKLRRDETFSAIRVKDLTRKIVNKAHHVYMDNSPPPRLFNWPVLGGNLLLRDHLWKYKFGIKIKSCKLKNHSDHKILQQNEIVATAWREKKDCVLLVNKLWFKQTSVIWENKKMTPKGYFLPNYWLTI